MKIHSIAIEAPEGTTSFSCHSVSPSLQILDKGPKTVKLFVNRQAIDFNDAKRNEAVQTLE